MPGALACTPSPLAQHPEPLGIRGRPALKTGPQLRVGPCLVQAQVPPVLDAVTHRREMLPFSCDTSPLLAGHSLESLPGASFVSAHSSGPTEGPAIPPGPHEDPSHSLLSKGPCFKGHANTMPRTTISRAFIYQTDENASFSFLSVI